MQIIRENKDILVSVLEVFLHDPIYMWSMNQVKMGVNLHAERAL